MEDVPEYEVRNGQMHIVLGTFEVVMPVNVFLVGCAKGTAAIKTWQRNLHATAKVIPVDFDSKFKRVYPKAKPA